MCMFPVLAPRQVFCNVHSRHHGYADKKLARKEHVQRCLQEKCRMLHVLVSQDAAIA